MPTGRISCPSFHSRCLDQSLSLHHPSSSVCLQWIYSWRSSPYFSSHPRGCGGDILQPSHVPHKSCQWLRSEDFSDTTGALMHSNMLYYNDISHQQYEGGCWCRRMERERVREGEVIKFLLLSNHQLSCQSHKSNQRLIVSLPLSLWLFRSLLLPSTISLSPAPSSVFC